VTAILPTHQISRWIFLRFIGFIYFCAFLSLWVQLSGLIGSDGILPVRNLMEAGSTQLGRERYWILPTVFWFSSSDLFLHIVCGVGSFASLLLFVGIAPVPLLMLLWVLYLSFVTASSEFLSFQWDNLLLEVGFLAIFFAPLQFKPDYVRETAPSKLVLWALWLLLFKLVFLSGAVKLLSGDTMWRNLTALQVHYETQPLPTVLGWYAHQLPSWFQKMSVVVVFAIELFVPFLIFMRKPMRLWGCGLLVGLQILIFLTGNYCFFNLLTIALCLLLIDDTSWPRKLRDRFPKTAQVGDQTVHKRSYRMTKWVVTPIIVLVLCVSFVQVLSSLRLPVRWFLPGVALYRVFQPFRTVNSYGLFAVMTTSRPEIVVEGSNNGSTWRRYEFKWKPQDLNQAPRWVAPHQPRLDWQMWFAALGSYRRNPWFVRFLNRLLEGSPSVLQLLANKPFQSQS